MQNKIQTAITFFEKNKAHNITIAIAMVVTVISYLILIRTDASANQEVLLEQAKSETSQGAANEQNTLAIDISGAVNKPGVYTLPDGSRLIDGLKQAEGLTDKADLELFYRTFNRASILSDQQKIYIPSIGENEPLTTSTETKESSSLISINTASESELDTLPGFGPITVKKIIDNRPYTTIQELTDSKILSESMLEKIQNQITL